MPTTERSGLAIHYDVEGSGLPLVLLHGGYTSSELWRLRGWVESLREERRLILVDLRGHGQSDKPHDPAAYRLSALASDVLAVLEIASRSPRLRSAGSLSERKRHFVLRHRIRVG